MKESVMPHDNPQYLRELGAEANPLWVSTLVKRITGNWKPIEPSRDPILVVFGGYQGSGKTSISQNLLELIPTRAIVSDQLRQTLFDLQLPFSEEFAQSVHAARNVLLDRAMSQRSHIVMDENATPARLALYMEMAKVRAYRVHGVHLLTPQQVLESRVRKRTPMNEYYNGTVDELRMSIAQQPMIDPDLFDQSYDTTVFKPSDIASHIAQAMHGYCG
jgi:predicted kinase